jgi:hypothetical protein
MCWIHWTTKHNFQMKSKPDQPQPDAQPQAGRKGENVCFDPLCEIHKSQTSTNPQEWTPKRVQDIHFDYGWEGIAAALVSALDAKDDAHNAALAAEWEAGLELRQREYENYCATIAAERERNETLAEALKRMPDLAYEVIIEHAGSVEDLPNELQCIADAALAKAREQP